MRLLVCGGAGFMGSHFIKYILTKYPEYRVVNFDVLTYAGNLNNLKEVAENPRYTFVKGDITDAIAVQKVVEEHAIEVIVNYAAETHVDRSIMDPEAFLRTGIFGTRNLLEVTKNKNLQKMIQISTDEVFGSIEQGEFTEESPFAPNSPYAASKAGADLLCRSYFVTYQTPVVVTHSCNYYGSHQYPEKVIPLFITNLLEGKKVPLYGDGLNVREWIHTSDHCRAVDAVLHKAEPGSVYNIGTGQEYTNIDLTKLVLQKMNLGEEMIEPVKDRAGHDRRYAIDHSKITRELGWEPQVQFEDGIAETIKWYRDNEWWWKDLKSGAYREYYQAQYQDR
ncbi:MAG: dTDP-glucose 4,6-dehydratase [Candidatus Magasanikbacteria bacterium]|nr:dTDP-glucose 4,6-dehydratase [Candidatus Magasanikbacteria bacterium]